jgi:aspartyl-tRNA(Asn)/glutamyl-tRNA(Gln) amidotransferase subunit A
VPIGLKDLIYTEGVRTTGGSSIYSDFVPTYSATVAVRLAEAGAVTLAKLQTIEFAMGSTSHYGPARNPWDTQRTPGGSSNGSGAALAARELPLAVGTDTGGSIRHPAAFCGITGLKPTYGLVSRHGVMPLSWSLDHVGPMARSVEDVALMLSVMAGYDGNDPTSLRSPSAEYTESLTLGPEGLRLGIPRDWFFDLIDPEVEAAVHRAAQGLADAGAEVVEVRLPNAHLAEIVGWIVSYAEWASLHEATLDRLADYGAPLTRQLLANAQFITARDYLRALRARTLIQRDLEGAFEDVDALILPGMLTTARLLSDMTFDIRGRRYQWEGVVARPMFLANVTGIPALSVPVGLSSEGLPLGMQIAARPFGESTCLRVGHAYQMMTDHHRAMPPLLAGGDSRG